MNQGMELITRCPLWAIKPESFAALLIEIQSGTFFQAKGFEVLKPTAIGKSPSNRAAVIPIQGVLTRDEPWAGTTYSAIANGVEQAAADTAIKRIVLAVDSPGGEVTGLPETAAVIRQAAKVKPVSAIVEGVSASAAYWLTSQANDITLTPSGEVGSVGTKVMHADISKALDDAGIKITEMQSGKFKTEWSPFQPLSDGAREDMQKRIDAVHADFLRAVAQGRGTRASVDMRTGRFGEGRMFGAKDALMHGLTDAVQAPREFFRAISAPVTENTGLPPSPQRARLELERSKF